MKNGTVVSVSGDTLVTKPDDGSANETNTVTGSVTLNGNASSIGALAAGDKVSGNPAKTLAATR